MGVFFWTKLCPHPSHHHSLQPVGSQLGSQHWLSIHHQHLMHWETRTQRDPWTWIVIFLLFCISDPYSVPTLADPMVVWFSYFFPISSDSLDLTCVLGFGCWFSIFCSFVASVVFSSVLLVCLFILLLLFSSNSARSPLTDLTGQAVPKSPKWSCKRSRFETRQGWIYPQSGLDLAFQRNWIVCLFHPAFRCISAARL